MPDLSLDLRYLRYAILVAEYGSFRRTADVLNIPQSTVSRRIQLLERRIGISLFDRTGSGARPTSEGERFLREATIGAEYLREAVDALALARRGHSGELRIGLMASLASGYLGDLLCSYHRRFPAIEIRLDEASAQVNSGAVLNGRLDAAFMPGDPRLPGCRAEILWQERIYAAIPDAHALCTLDAVSWDDLRHQTFLVSVDAAGSEIEDHIVRQLSEPGFRPTISVQRVGRENLINMVAKGFGITLTTNSTLGITYSGVCFLPVVGREETVSSSMVWSVSNQNPALKLLLGLTRSHEHEARLRKTKFGTE
ncbi:LysR family transcriptional regulator [Mesorhizobium loti]|nr:LysR family transcriptional regulator [Mesorhizobium loti]